MTETAAPGINAARVIARVRWLMIVSGLTTIIAVAAVISVIGYRVFRSGGSGAAAPIDSAITLPKGAVVIASAVSEGRIVVMLDVGGATEIRTFDVKTLKQTGRITFATKP
ncbi:MAG TPA: DUF6476 family protein [Xanthobacteraceae bacterium]|nr:DUF6476 family protein [Xanthobacteraceae bacterium]